MNSVEVILVASRFVEFATSMLLFGALAFRPYVRAGFAEAPEVYDELDAWLRPVLAAAAVLALVASVAWLDIEAVSMGAGWADAVNIRTISAVLIQTEFGGAWMWHLAFGAAMLALFFFVGWRHKGIAQNILLMGMSAALLASSAWAGHAVMHNGAAGAVLLTIQVVHLLAASAWLGSLPALGYVFHRAQRDQADRSSWRIAARHILPRYSQAGYLAVGLILLTGCLQSWFMVDNVDALFRTTYGHILIVKIALFVLMVSVAIINRFVVTPDAARQKPSALMTEMAFKRLWRNVALELSLGISIIAVVSVLGTLAPAMSGPMG